MAGSDVVVTAIVLAAGGSRRLGRPKQLLDYRGAPLLEAVLATARAAPVDQLLLALGGAADQVRDRVRTEGAEVVVNPEFGTGCGSSIRTAMGRVRADADGIVLLLGDQPGVSVASIEALVTQAAAASVGVCRYADGRGHPLWFHRRMFSTLADLHGDKAVWKVLAHHDDVVEVPRPGPVPLDVDTWEDYRRLLRDAARTAGATGPGP